MLDKIEFNSGDTVVDCGANVGELYQGLKNNINNLNYIGFEPDPIVFRCLEKNVNSNNIKLYVGTNPNIDFIVQSLFWIVVLFLIPKSSHKKSKYINLTSSLMVFLFYLHLVGEKGYYERYLRKFDISLSLDNFWLLSMLLVFFLLSNVISDLISSRFYNLVNYLPFMFLISGTYNTFNLNIFM